MKLTTIFTAFIALMMVTVGVSFAMPGSGDNHQTQVNHQVQHNNHNSIFNHAPSGRDWLNPNFGTHRGNGFYTTRYTYYGMPTMNFQYIYYPDSQIVVVSSTGYSQMQMSYISDYFYDRMNVRYVYFQQGYAFDHSGHSAFVDGKALGMRGFSYFNGLVFR
jgi:hypothetical protein